MKTTTDSSPVKHSPRVTPDRLLPGLETLISRGLVYLVLLAIIASLIWMANTGIDVVVQTRGRITTKGEPVEISFSRGGIVRDLRVTVGEVMAVGDVLFRMDDFEDQAEAARLVAEIEVLETKRLSQMRRAEALEGTLGMIDEEARNLEQQIELAETVVKRRRLLHAKGAAASEEVEGKESATLVLKARIAQVKVEKQHLGVEANTQRAMAEESAAERRVLDARLEQARERIARCVVVAPVAGVVSSLAFSHPNAALAAGETAAAIIPEDSPLMVKVEIPNGSMRHIRTGAQVRVELDAYPGEDYGFFSGVLQRIDPDANERGHYEAWITLGARAGTEGGKTVNIRAGLAADVRIINERRTMLSYLLNPLTRVAGRGFSAGE